MENIALIDRLIGWFERIWHAINPPKPSLNFEEKDFVHWYDEDSSQSGIIVEMFIINRGKKPTTIRKIRARGEDSRFLSIILVSNILLLRLTNIGKVKEYRQLQ